MIDVAASKAPGSPDLSAGFAHPNPDFSPVPIWWWSGEKVTLERLRWQLERLVAQGVHNLVVLDLAPTGPTYGALADQPRLFSEQWWELWDGLCAYAASLDARLWFYDQIGFSGANLQGDLVTRHPEFIGMSVRRSDAGEPLYVRHGFDYLSADACAALLDIVHGEFERRLGRYLGNVIAGSFQDELPSLPTWSAAFPAEFARRRGYAIEPVLGALWAGDDAESRRVRGDYQRTRTELAEEAFFRPLFDWHDRHGMVVGCDQQSPSRAGEPVGTVQQYADYPRTHRWFSAPGSDHHGEARIHSSLAHHYGRPRTWIESFHSSGWGGTLEETFDWLVPWMLAGATLYNPHAVYYSTRGGWFEWAPPSTCWRQPYWAHYGQFSGAVARMSWLLTRGRHVCDVGVLFPSATAQAGTLLQGAPGMPAGGGALPFAAAAHRAYLDLTGRMVWYDAHPGVLDLAHRDFDVLDDDTVAGASVSEGALHTGHEAYRAIVLPSCPVLEPATAERLAAFARAGGLLVAVGEVAPELREIAVCVDDPAAVPEVLERLGREIELDGPALHRVVEDRHVLVVPAAVEGSATAQPMLGGKLGWSTDLREQGYDFDPARYRASTGVRLPATACDVEQWNPQTGKAIRLSSSTGQDGRVEVEVPFDGPLAVLVWRESSEAAAGETAESPTKQGLSGPGEVVATVGGAWDTELVPTIDNTYGDFALPAASGDFPVQEWRPEHRVSGAEDWAPVLVGVGTFGWVTEPDGTRRPARYSLTRGIEKDPLHTGALGPSGRVPEEFWHVENVEPGQVVAYETTVPSDAERELWLAIGTNGSAAVTWNGKPLSPDPGGYLRIDPIRLVQGRNRLEVAVTAERRGALRGFWAVVTDPEAFERPRWLVPADANVVGSTVRFTGRLELDELPATATLQLGTDGPARLLLNGSEVGVQGAFEPYGSQNRVLPYDITGRLELGENTVEVELTDIGGPLAVFADGWLEYADGSTRTFVTDGAWSSTRDGEPSPHRERRQPVYDTRWPLLRARPHPLPGAAWLEPGVDEGGVLPIVPDARPENPGRREEFRVVVPPGATAARLPIRGRDIEAWVDGEPVEFVPDGAGGSVELPNPLQEKRILELRTTPLDGRTEGALWDGPITYDCGPGRMRLEPWSAVGLGSYAGGIRLRTTVRLENPTQQGRTTLDLGRVRGTAEVRVNGKPAGVRVWSPYRVDITDLVRHGDNALEVLVLGTLAPYLDDASPTPYVFPGQRLTGILGPVTVRMTNAGEEDDQAGGSDGDR